MGVKPQPDFCQDKRFTVLAYGDSNTWGFDCETGGRLPSSGRWPKVAEAASAGQIRVLEDGLNGRTTSIDDPQGPGRNGLKYLELCLKSHGPMDGITIMLGTNDFKRRFGLRANDVAQGIGKLLAMIDKAAWTYGYSVPPRLVIVPPPLEPEGKFSVQFDAGFEESRRLLRCAVPVIKHYGAEVLDSSGHCKVCPGDGIHLSRAGQFALGQVVWKTWERWLSKKSHL